jgi:hypothetical protein
MLINKISLNQHEIASGFEYDGDPKRDIELIDSYERFLDNLTLSSVRETYRRIVPDLKNSAIKNL